MDSTSWFPSSTLLLADLFVRLGLALRVVMRKQAPSVSLAWLLVILFLPLAGPLAYLLLGEHRLGEKRARHAATSHEALRRWFATLTAPPPDWPALHPGCEQLHRQVEAVVGLPTIPGNELLLIPRARDFFQALISDINQARHSCLLEFYIWHEGGLADQVAEAVLRAAQRGVRCRVLLDSVGSKDFLRSATARKMRQQGVAIAESLPAGLIRALFVRIDLRNHRKIALVDGEIAYSGSQNLMDPRYFKQDEGVGQWIDTMVRVRGPVVEVLAGTFRHDWYVETGRELGESLVNENRQTTAAGNAPVQVVPSGPGFVVDAIHHLLLYTIYAAKRELVLTTPYFVPDISILTALKTAAQRGVRVTIIVPAHGDSRLSQLAGQARFEELCAAGVRIMRFHEGLLHAKTITVDGEFSLIGSVNLDMRSFWLNFELTLFVYDRDFTHRLMELQQEYFLGARPVDLPDLRQRGFAQRLLENTALLIGPLL
ncbi:MAG: cardiolipin synthase [Desulfobulbaceae bacterium A2]|nr:MAG: cardiolipin synthase [Desulfobulbaceae bacterium A2]